MNQCNLRLTYFSIANKVGNRFAVQQDVAMQSIQYLVTYTLSLVFANTLYHVKIVCNSQCTLCTILQSQCMFMAVKLVACGIVLSRSSSRQLFMGNRDTKSQSLTSEPLKSLLCYFYRQIITTIFRFQYLHISQKYLQYISIYIENYVVSQFCLDQYLHKRFFFLLDLIVFIILIFTIFSYTSFVFCTLIALNIRLCFRDL